jgi:hypothetical protein
MIEQTIIIDKKFIQFINQCFGNANFEAQHNQYNIGQYPLNSVIEAYYKFISDEWVFKYNCSDCSFPKFQKIGTDYAEACPLCGD